MILLSFAIFCLYIAFVVYRYGVPDSISDTYYLLEATKKGFGWVFTVWCWAVIFTMLPAWLDMSTENTQFLAFLACAGLGFVGTAPQFKEGMSRKVHYTGAGISAVAAILLTALAGGWYWQILLLIPCAYFTYKMPRTWLFWAEMCAFVSTFLTKIFLKS